MQKLLPTTTVNIDDAVFEVASMSPNVQSMIQYLDSWRQKEADLTSDLLMVRGALKDLQNQLLVQIQEERATAAAEAESVSDDPVTEYVEQPAYEDVPVKKATRKPAKKA